MSLSACVTLPDPVSKRDAAKILSIPKTYQIEQPSDTKHAEELLELFDDAVINELVMQALQNNLDILLASQKMQEAGFNANAKWGDLLPQVTTNIATSKSKGATETYMPSLDVSWELDLWGKLHQQKKALDANSQAVFEDYKAMRYSIAAQVMQAWFDIVTATQIVALEQERLKNLQKSADNTLSTYQAGLGSLDDLDAVKRDIAQTKSSLARYQDNQHIAIRSLKLLLGQYPDHQLSLTYELPVMLGHPYAHLPANLLTERPDVRSAWQQILAADSSVKSTHKEMWPSLKLTGSLGAQSVGFENLMSGATIWTLASQFTMPLFNAGQLKNNLYAAQSRAEQAWINYLKIVLNAFQEVEQALDRETLFAKQEAEQEKAVHYAENTARIFEERYKNGLISILEYLTAQNAVFDMKSQLLEIRNQRLKNRVALSLALGKGV